MDIADTIQVELPRKNNAITHVCQSHGYSKTYGGHHNATICYKLQLDAHYAMVLAKDIPFIEYFNPQDDIHMS